MNELSELTPIAALVGGLIMILAPMVILVGFALGVVLSGSRKASPTPKNPVDEEVVRSLKILHDEQSRFLSEIRDLSEDNRETLAGLIRRTEEIQELLNREKTEDHPIVSYSTRDSAKN